MCGKCSSGKWDSGGSPQQTRGKPHILTTLHPPCMPPELWYKSHESIK